MIITQYVYVCAFCNTGTDEPDEPCHMCGWREFRCVKLWVEVEPRKNKKGEQP